MHAWPLLVAAFMYVQCGGGGGDGGVCKLWYHQAKEGLKQGGSLLPRGLAMQQCHTFEWILQQPECEDNLQAAQPTARHGVFTA